MPTSQPRLNLTLDAEMMKMIAGLAKKDKQSLSSTAKKLLLLALELQEDIYFSKLADERENDGSQWISHEEAWKK
jgi:hypothetical protein